MAEADPNQATTHDVAAAEAADVETLRLAYAEAQTQVELARDERRLMAAEYAALPPSAGAILALFAAFRPEGLPEVSAYLYGLSVIPFLCILGMTVRGTNELWAASTRAEMAKKTKLSNELSPHDLLEITSASSPAWSSIAGGPGSRASRLGLGLDLDSGVRRRFRLRHSPGRYRPGAGRGALGLLVRYVGAE